MYACMHIFICVYIGVYVYIYREGGIYIYISLSACSTIMELPIVESWSEDVIGQFLSGADPVRLYMKFQRAGCEAVAVRR